MSKCGDCDYDGDFGAHMVLRCKSNMIPKVLYEKAACWMADYEEPCHLEETMPKEDVEEYLLDVAMDIMNQIYRIYADSDGGRN